MCLAVPARISSIEGSDVAHIDVLGVQRTCSLRLTPDAQVGDYVLVHAGFAIQIVEEQDAAETISLLQELPDLLGDDFAAERAPQPEPAAAPDAVPAL